MVKIKLDPYLDLHIWDWNLDGIKSPVWKGKLKLTEEKTTKNTRMWRLSLTFGCQHKKHKL